MESRFNRDFGHVRVHDDDRAAASAQSLNARAYTVGSSVVFGAREEVRMPPPGDPRPARLEVRMRDLPWDAFYAPVARVVGYAAERLNALQFLTIRGYLTMVFGALVALLMVLTVWQ